MTILTSLYNIVIAPIEWVIETVFCFTYIKIGLLGVGGAIIAVSLVMNFLALPLYNIADKIQQNERDIQKRLSYWVNHIKAHFTGDERFMMLSFYYKQNNYSPLYALRGSLSIILEVPFFIAAYHYLSHCPTLNDAHFLFLSNLSKPDALIKLAGGGTL